MEMPVFVPTKDRSLAAALSLPAGDPTGAPIVWFPGGTHTRTRDTVFRDIAPVLAAKGRPVMRLDYPGLGLSGGRSIKGPDRERLVATLNEAGEWFREACGADTWSAGGICGGGWLGLSVAAKNPNVGHVVCISLVMNKSPNYFANKRRRKILGGIAALDTLGSKITPALARPRHLRDEPFTPFPGMVEDIIAGSHARVTFMYGSEDHSYHDFKRLVASGLVPENVTSEFQVLTQEGTQLYGFTKPRDMEWMKEQLVELLDTSKVVV